MLFFATYQHIFSSAWTVEPLTGSLRLPISTLTKAIATEQLSARCHSSTTYKKAIDFPIHHKGDAAFLYLPLPVPRKWERPLGPKLSASPFELKSLLFERIDLTNSVY